MLHSLPCFEQIIANLVPRFSCRNFQCGLAKSHGGHTGRTGSRAGHDQHRSIHCGVVSFYKTLEKASLESKSKRLWELPCPPQRLVGRNVETATFLTAYKGNLSGCNAFTRLGRDYIAAAQTGKGQALHIWSWQKVSPALTHLHIKQLTQGKQGQCALEWLSCGFGWKQAEVER